MKCYEISAMVYFLIAQTFSFLEQGTSLSTSPARFVFQNDRGKDDFPVTRKSASEK